MNYLLALVLFLAACGARAAPPKTPAETLDADLPTMLTCWNGGDVLYRETTRTLDLHARPDVLTIFASGAWHVEGQRERRGCLSAGDLAVLETRLGSVRRAAPDAPLCAGLPTHSTLIEVPGVGALSYQWPCAPGPDADTAAGIELARDLTRRAPPTT
jgi:hypothetical protein